MYDYSHMHNLSITRSPRSLGMMHDPSHLTESDSLRLCPIIEFLVHYFGESGQSLPQPWNLCSLITTHGPSHLTESDSIRLCRIIEFHVHYFGEFGQSSPQPWNPYVGSYNCPHTTRRNKTTVEIITSMTLLETQLL